MILQKNIAEAEALLWVFIGFNASVAEIGRAHV